MKKKYIVTFKDKRRTEIIAEEWIGEDDWMIFLIAGSEIMRVRTSELRILERRVLE